MYCKLSVGEEIKKEAGYLSEPCWFCYNMKEADENSSASICVYSGILDSAPVARFKLHIFNLIHGIVSHIIHFIFYTINFIYCLIH
jgi:hypothetical protein